MGFIHEMLCLFHINNLNIVMQIIIKESRTMQFLTNNFGYPVKIYIYICMSKRFVITILNLTDDGKSEVLFRCRPNSTSVDHQINKYVHLFS
jgi:hypothetical protein